MTYYFFALMMILLTLLAVNSAPDAQGSDLEVSPLVAEQMEAIRQHAAAAAPGSKRPFFPRVFLYHLLNGLYHLGLHLGMNFSVIQGICAAAWAAHVAEAAYAYRLCRKCRGTPALTTAVYVAVTFVGGFGQLVTLKEAVARYEEEKEKRG